MESIVIYMHEGINIVIFGIPGAYLHSNILKGKTVLMKLYGWFVEKLCDVKPQLKYHLRYEKLRKLIYMRLLHKLYACM